jgi:cytochrome c biogenesis protein CcmG, thiol:disulfide interchange protein DsbE
MQTDALTASHPSRRRVLQQAAAGCAALALPAARATDVGQAAPAFSLPSTAGEVSLRQWQGQVVLLDFWASWCTPCRLSFPWLGEMQARYGARGLHVLGVNLDRRREDAERFLARTPAAFLLAFDPAGEVPRRYAVKAMPSSLIIGRDGLVRMHHAGFRDDDRAPLEAALDAALRAG